MIQFIKYLFSPIRVTNRIWDRFVDTGKVPKSIIRLLAFKIMKREELSQREMAIFCANTDAINNMIIQVSQKDI